MSSPSGSVSPLTESGAERTGDAPVRDSRYATKVLVTVTAVALLVNYVETMVIPGVPVIQKDFATTSTIASWITSAFLIVGSAVAPLFGKLGDAYGKKRMVLVSLTFYTFGVGIAGFSPSIYFLLFSRAVQGVGFAIVPLSIAIITDTFPREKIAPRAGSHKRDVCDRRGRRTDNWLLRRPGPGLAVRIPQRVRPEHRPLRSRLEGHKARYARTEREDRLSRGPDPHVRSHAPPHLRDRGTHAGLAGR